MAKPLAIRPEILDIKAPLINGTTQGNPIRVTVASPKQQRRAVFKIAQYFRREFHYDFPQYGYDGDETDPKHVAFLWVHPEAAFSPDFRVPCIGATCFRWREYIDHTPEWAMQWIWIHPFFRRQGLLKMAWPEFASEFKGFRCEPPISDAMQFFLSSLEGSSQ